MSSIREILLLGNPKLYEKSNPVKREELDQIKKLVEDLHDTLIDFRKRHGTGRSIAAPQIGVMKRVIYMNIDTPMTFINPVFAEKSKEMIILWDDCFCFPDLLVKVKRHKTCKIKFLDINWQEQEMGFEDTLSELLQHEYDHLEGILAVFRAIDSRSFALKSQKHFLNEV